MPPHSHAQRWLLAYDIRDPKRLGRVWRYLRKLALPLQYSVYIVPATPRQIEDIVHTLRQLIDERTDDLRLYPMTESTRIWHLGQPFNVEGHTLTDELLDAMIQPSQAIDPPFDATMTGPRLHCDGISWTGKT